MAMVGESIFNLIPQHAKFSEVMKKKVTSMVPEHISVVHPDVPNNVPFTNAPPSSQPESDDYPSHANRPPVPSTSAGRGPHQVGMGVPSGGPPRGLISRAGIPRNAVQELDPYEVARRRQLAQNAGGAMAAALTPEETYKQKMKSLQLKDHAMENRNKLKEQSIINGIMKAQGETPQTRPAARKPEFTGKPKNPAPGGVNFLEENRRREYSNKSAEVQEKKARLVKYAGPKKVRPAGQIPKYLVERKIEMEVDKAMAEDAEKKKHGGPAVMPEEERLATLAELEKQKDAAIKEINLIPPSKHQLFAYKSQIEKLEKKLAEIDKAIILFSRKVVYVQ